MKLGQRLQCADCLIEFHNSSHDNDTLPFSIQVKVSSLLRKEVKEAVTIYNARALCHEHFINRLYPNLPHVKVK